MKRKVSLQDYGFTRTKRVKIVYVINDLPTEVSSIFLFAQKNE